MRHLTKGLYLLFIVFFFSSTKVYSNNIPVDSLYSEFKKETNDSIKLKHLYDIAWSYMNSDIQKMRRYSKEYLTFGKERGLEYAAAVGNNLLGVTYCVEGDKEKGLTYFEEALRLAEEYGPEELVMRLNNNIGITYIERNELNKAFKYHKKAYNTAIEQKDTLSQAIFVGNMGLDLILLEATDEALEFLKIQKNLLDALHNHDSEKPYYYGLNYSSTAKSYLKQNEISKAAVHAKKAIEIMSADNNYYGLIETYVTYGKIQEAQGDLKSAELSYRQALNIAETHHFKSERFQCYHAISGLYFQQKKYVKAAKAAKLAYTEAKGINKLKFKSDAMETYVKAESNLGNYATAFEVNQQLILLNDTLATVTKNQNLNNLKLKYNLTQWEAENQILMSEKITNEARLRQQTYLIIATLCMIGVITILAFFFFRAKKYKSQQNQLLETMVEERAKKLKSLNVKLTTTSHELERFAYITSHDLKEPLRNINGFVKLIQRRSVDKFDEGVEENFNFIVDNVNQMRQLIDDILSFSKVSNEDITIQKIDLNAIVTGVEKHLSGLIQKRNGVIKYQQLPIIYSNKPQLHILFKNLIENGIKYNKSEQPEVAIQYTIVNGYHQISFHDNGIGVEVKYHEQIFDMFKRLHNRVNYQGSGLGLAICKKVIKRLGGDILLTSNLGEGSTFTIILPVLNAEETAFTINSNTATLAGA